MPDVDTLRRLMQSLAMLDAIICPEWQYRYYSFNSRWAPHEQLGSMRNGAGDFYFALFNSSGCWIKGFDHESHMTPFHHKPPKLHKGVLDNVPSEFTQCLSEPAFVIEETTFCIWRLYRDAQWKLGPVEFNASVDDPDGSAGLLFILDGHPKTYKAWSQDYFELEVSLDAVRRIYAHERLDESLLRQLNSSISLADLANDIAEIGYPS